MKKNQSYKVQTSALVLLGCILAAPFAVADKKDDFYSKGEAAVKAGDAITARDMFCAAAKEDSEYKDAKAQCDTYKASAAKTLNRYTINFGEGQAAMQKGDYDSAEIKFRN